jgi:hypothetical protein
MTPAAPPTVLVIDDDVLVRAANEYMTKAFQLRDHTSERERLQITAYYYRTVTGELDKAAQVKSGVD